MGIAINGIWKGLPNPSANGTDNVTVADVVGNKDDSHYGGSNTTNTSLAARIKTLIEHIHKPAKCYPTLAAGVTVTADAAAWTLGAFIEIVPINTITSDFDFHYIAIEGVSAGVSYELVLYQATTEIGRVRFTAVGIANNVVIPDIPIQTGMCVANAQVQAKLASSSTNADTATISTFYHTY